MTEKEKMLSGRPYFAFDEVLVKERSRAKELIFEINKLSPSETEKINELLKSLLGKIGKNSIIELPFRCDYGYNIEIGDNFFSNYNCTILDCAKVTIGDNVMFAPNVSLFTAGHPLDAEKRNAGWEYAFPITIGNNVWIGGNVVINPGITIGNNVVIGSGSVVTKDIPDNMIAMGNPCKTYRKITEEDRNFYFKNLEF
jgi:maltose O-acetyltransferase